MKRFVIRTAWLPLILAAATAFGQAVPKAGSTAEPATPAKPPALSASLLLIKADWSKVPAAKAIEAELRTALKDATVPKDLLDELPASGPQILFSSGTAAIYTQTHYRELEAWLNAKGLLVEQMPFRAEAGSIGVVVQVSNEKREFSGMLSKPYEFLGMPALPSASDQPFVARKVEFQWHFGELEQGSNPFFWVERRLLVQQQIRGREGSQAVQPLDTCDFRWRRHLDNQVVLFDTFPPSVNASRSDEALSEAAHHKGFVAVVVVRPAEDTSADGASARLNLPDTVQINIASKGRSYIWPAPRAFPRTSTSSSTSAAAPGPQTASKVRQNQAAPSADPFAAPPASSPAGSDPFGAPAASKPVGGDPFAAPPGSPATASDTFAAPPADAKGKPAGSAARQISEGKIIIAWSENKDVAWGYSSSVGKWARQEINPPADGSTGPIVDSGSSVWPVGSAYYGFSGKVARWDVLRLPAGHNPKPVMYSDHTVVTDGEDIYTFADATGRWSSTKEAGETPSVNPPGDSLIKVFSLQHARAVEVQRMVTELFARDGAAASVDERTNGIVVRATAPVHELITAIILRLDQPRSEDPFPAVTTTGSTSTSTGSATDLRKAFDAKEQQAAQIAAQLRKLQAEKSSDKPQVKKLTDDLRRAVAEAFAARQQLHQAELAELSQRMRQMEQTVQMRSRIAEQIIDRRVQDLLNPDLQWDQLADSGPRLPSKVTPAPATGSSSTSSSRPRVLVGAAFGAWADEICEALGLTVQRLKKEEVSDQKLLGCLKITAISERNPASEFQVGDIITMMQVEGARGGVRRVSMNIRRDNRRRGTENIPVTVEFSAAPAAAEATMKTPLAAGTPTVEKNPADLAAARVMYGAAFGADADKVWNSIGIKVHLLTFDETAPDHKYLGCPRIVFVDPDGPAHELQVGDLIVTLQVGSSTGRNIVGATLDILRGMETFRIIVEYPSPPPTKGQPASSLRTLREPKVSVGFGSEAFQICKSLGLTVQGLKKDEISDEKSLSSLKIAAISSDSPASELKVGDIITMMQTGGALGGGRRLTMNILRGAETFPVTVEFPAAPAATAENDANSSPSKPSPSSTDATDTDQLPFIKYGARFGNQETKIWNTLGVKVVAVAKEDLPISGYQGGAKITEIRPDSPAAGLHVGDIIVGLLNWDVTSPERLLWALSQPISNTSGRGQAFGKFWNVETAIIYFLRDKSALQATIEFRLEPPPAAGPPPTPVDAGSAALSQAPPGNANLALPTSTAGRPLILRSADSFRQTIYDLEDHIKRHKQNIAKSQDDLTAAQPLDQDERKKKQFSLQSAEQALAKDQAELAFVREEFASQIRLLELALQDAQSQAETAKQNARRIEQLLSNRVVSQEEAEKARQNASSAKSSVDQIVTLLDLYRKADPAKTTITATADANSTASTVSQRSAVDPAEVLSAAEDFDHRLKRAEGNLRRLEDIDAINFGGEGKTATEKLKLKEQSLGDARRLLATTRGELPALIRMLDQALQDAQSKAAQAQDIARNLDQAVAKGEAPRPQAQTAQEIAKSCLQQVERLKALLDLYRKADPTKAAPAEAANDQSPKPSTKPKQGEGQPR